MAICCWPPGVHSENEQHALLIVISLGPWHLQAARADNVAALRALPGVTVVLRDAELRRRHENSRYTGYGSPCELQVAGRKDSHACCCTSCRIWKESWLSAFFHKPCNHELFVLQSLNMEGGCLHCRGK